MFYEKRQHERLNVRYVKLIGMCFVAVGLALALLMLTGTEEAKADTVVPPGPVSDLTSGGPWNNLGSPYWVEGDIFVPNTPSPPGSPDNTLTIDGLGGPVEIRFNGSYSFQVGISGSGNPASLVVNGVGKSVLFTRNGTFDWVGIEFTDSAVFPSVIENAIIEYTSGGPDVALWLSGVTGISVLDSEIRNVYGSTQAVGIGLYHGLGILNTDNNFIIGNSIHDVSILVPSPGKAAGIFMVNASANTINDNNINNIFFLGGGGGGGSTGIYLQDSSYNTIGVNVLNRIESDWDVTVGIDIFGDSDFNDVLLNEIEAVEAILPNGIKAYGILLRGDLLGGTSPDDNDIDGNLIQAVFTIAFDAYAIGIIDGVRATIGNNTIHDNWAGIEIATGSYLTIYNSEIRDNMGWGIYMDASSKGQWIVDDYALLDNDFIEFNGPIFITAGKLTFYDIKLSGRVAGVSIAPGALMELEKSPNSLITNDVWVEGTLYINSSKWEVDVAFNGEHGIQVNSTGQMYIQDNGTGPSIITDGPSDNDGGSVGVDNFRYYFKVLTGATFRLLDSEVSEVGWVTGGFNELALYIQTSDALISNNRLLRGFYGILIQGGGWTFENNEIDGVGRLGMWVEGGSGTVITNNTINTTDAIGYGMLLSDFGHWIENNTIITLGGSADAISLFGGGNHDILLNTITTFGNSADGILFDSSFNNRAYDNTIQVAGGSAYCMYIFSASGNQLQGNTLSDGAGGIFLEVAGSTRIGNNTVANSDSGIVLINSPGVQLYNNEIYDNFFWGIWMDSSSSGNWYVDDFGSLINNPAVLKGSLIVTTGKLTFYNIGSSEVQGVAISSGGIMELGASPTSLISNNVWVDGVLYINSSKWEIDVSANGTYGIQVNGTGTMIIQDNGTGPSTVTDGPFDVDDRSANDFRYYFKVMSGSKFRLLNSVVSEVGWHPSPVEESALYIDTLDAAITDSTILRNYIGLWIATGGWTVDNVTLDELDSRGISLDYAPLMTIIDCTITTIFDSSEGIVGSGNDNATIMGNTITTFGDFSRGIYLMDSDDSVISGNTIDTNGTSADGILLSNSDFCTVEYNTVDAINDNARCISLSPAHSNYVANNTVLNGTTGIYVNNPTGRNTIYNNTAYDNFYGIHLSNAIDQYIEKNRAFDNVHGYYIAGSDYNTMIYNNASNNVIATGIWLNNANNNTIMFNDFFNNDEGIRVFLSDGNKIAYNNVTWNINTGVVIESSSDNLLTNNFVANTTAIPGIQLLNACTGNIVANNTVSDNGNGILLSTSGVSGTTIINNTILNNGAGIRVDVATGTLIIDNIFSGNSYGILVNPSSNGNTIEDNRITGSSNFGILLQSSTSIKIGNNTIWNNDFGIQLETGSTATLFNNEIFDNPSWGLWMTGTTSATWYVDDFASLINNQALLRGDIRVIAGKLSFYNIGSSEVQDVAISLGALMELGASPASLVTNNVTVAGELFINSSKWEIDVSYNGEFGIQVNNGGLMFIQDNGTGPSTVTDGPSDNDGGVVGTDDFRYYFMVMFGSTFRLFDSEVSEVGWHSSPANESALLIQTSDVYISRSWILRNYDGIYASGDGWTIEHTTFDDLDRKGMILIVANNVVINNCTINTTGVAADGIYAVGGNFVDIIDSTINTLDSSSPGLYLSNSENCTIFNNDIIANISFGIYVSSGGWHDINDNSITNSDNGIRLDTSEWNNIVLNTVTTCANEGIYLSGSKDNIIGNNTIWGNGYGIRAVSSVSTILYNNEIYDNMQWGIRMDIGSLGVWYVDSYASLLNNDGYFIGPLTVLSTGDMDIEMATLTIHDVSVDSGGILDVLNSYSTIISWNLTINGITTLDNSSWEINNTFDGEHWILVTPAGTLNVINGSLISAFNTAYHYDFFVDGTATFTDSTVEYAGYDFDIGSTGIFVTSPNVLFDNMIIRHSMAAIGVEGVSITIQNVEIYNCSVGVALFNGSSQVLDNLDIHDLYGLNVAVGIVAENYTDVTISNVTIYNVSSTGMGVGILMTAGAHNYFMENIDIGNVSAFGMFLDNADGMITDTIIMDCWVGLQTEQSDVSIMNMDITDASLLGMSIQVNSTVEFISGTIIESQGGIRVAYNSIIYVNHTTIENRTINNITNGIFAQDGTAYLFNTTILNQSVGVWGMDGSYMEIYDSLLDSNEDSVAAENQTSMLIVNSSIGNGKNLDYFLNWDSHIVSLNTTFDNSSVMFTDILSTLTVQWFLHIKVEGVFAEPVPGIDVRVTENINGSYDVNFISDSEGRVKWILITEYTQNQTSTTQFTPFNISAWNATKQGIVFPIISKSMWVIVTLDTNTTTIDYIRLEYFDGTPVAEGTILSADDVIVVYARAYNYTLGLVGDVSANWVVNGGIGGLSSATGSSVTFNATTVGIGNISATYSIYTNATGNITIVPGAVADIQIIPSGLESYTADESDAYQVFGYDSDGNLNTTWIPEWSWDGPNLGIMTQVTPDGYNYSIDFDVADTSLISVNVSGIPSVFNTSAVTVVPGKVVTIIIIPSGAETNTTDEVFNFTVQGHDADGNLNTTWIPDVGWAGMDLGIITIVGFDVSLEFTTVGSGNIAINDSADPAVLNDTKSFTVDPGLPYRIQYVSGSGQTGLASSTLGTPFVVLVEDFDGNPVPNVEINWSLDGWPAGASGQMLSDYNSMTDVNGEATTTLTLGDVAGTYWVNATNITIALVGEPVTFDASVTDYIIDEIIITDGSGIPITDIILTADDTLTLYAWAYNYTGGLIGQIDVNWSSIGGIGGFTTSVVLQSQATFDLSAVGVGNITIEFMNATITLTNTTGDITVMPGAVVGIIITPSTATGTTDDSEAFSAVGYDADGNENWTWTPTWAWDGLILGSLTPVDVFNYTVDYHTVGVEDLRVSLSINPAVFDIAAVTVYPGQLVRIEITPWPSTAATADDVGAFSVIGYDADNNENWTWTPSWDWAGPGLGVLTSIDDYNYSVPYDTVGTDTINVEVSGNPNISNNTDVVVSAGQVVRIEITPWPSVSDNVGNTGLFSVTGYDAGDNENWTWLPVWNWDGSGLGVLLSIDAFNYSVTYDSEGSDVINVSLTGDPAIYNTTSVITIALPTVDYIVIMDAPGGVGSIIGAQNFSVGQSAMFYAAGFNLTSGYVMDVDVTWSSSDIVNATVIFGPGTSTTFTANINHGGTVVITATNASLPIITNSTGVLSVLDPTVDFIQIRDAPANDGSIVQTGSYSEGQTDTFHAAGYNDTAGYLGDMDVSWESTNTAVGVVSPGSGSSTTFTAGTEAGTTTVTAVYLPGISNDTGIITVSVVAPPLVIDSIQIRDSPGGLGSAITQISLVAGGRITVYAAGYNTSTGEFVDNVSVTWDVTVGLGTLGSTTGASTMFTATDATGSQVTGTILATSSGMTATMDVTVELSPLAPMGLTVSQRPEGESLLITWAANIESDIMGYVIFRSTTSGADFTELAMVSDRSNTDYIDTGLTDGTPYYYYIMAFDTNQNFSPASAEASGVSDRDTDGDNTFNLQDNDDDGDGLSDAEEDALGTDSLDTDTDDDGHDDLEDKYPLDPSKWEDKTEPDEFPFWIIIIIIIILVLILLFLLMKKRKDEEGMPSEEDLEEMEAAEELPEEDLEELSEEGYFGEDEEPSSEDEESREDKETPWDDTDEEGDSSDDEDISEEEGSPVEGESKEETGLEDLAEEFECPDCGGPISGSMTKCPNCGLEFEEEE